MADCLIRDINLAPAGQRKIDWAATHMPVLRSIAQEFAATKPFAGLKVAVSVHLEAKTAYLALVLREAGAEVSVTGSNPLSTQDEIAAALVAQGLRVHAWHGATNEEYFDHIRRTLEPGPDLLIDDGGDLVSMLHTEMRELLPRVRGGCEETTTGIIRLRAMAADQALAFPMMAVNDARCKHLFDNRFGTGQSTWDGIMRTTNMLVAGKTVVVLGFGWCGRGVAMRAKGLGANVIVCEVDPVKALEALMEGYRVMSSLEAAAEGDIFITVTGCKHILGKEHFLRMKDNAILANAGHFDVEVDKVSLAQLTAEVCEVRPNIQEYRLHDGRRLHLLGEGRLVNLAAGDGHPVEIMDLSFAIQALALDYLNRRRGELTKGVYTVPPEIDQRVAELKLAALGIQIDRLTAEQEEYLRSWQVE
ncbi:MAG TPA: adenosylhomocysteinase [Firmicutes bacterium]|jgi:adenosylhomocysteinase|nr:adenosylhomocysteinase [Bacillota bacterium]HOQ23251.1 adenosylhomocysteinase [Bacillota bacterium]